MATALNEMQFELLPYAEAEQGTIFGIGCDVSVNEDGFQPGGPEWYTEDSNNPINGAMQFGRDHLMATAWQWDLHVNRDQVANALDTLGKTATEWRAPLIRNEIGAFTSIRYQLAGRTRRVFGRPRRFEYSPSNAILNGYVPIQADFQCVDSYTYDDVEQAVMMPLEVLPSGGLVLPTVFPTSSLPSGSRDSTVLVDGDAETYPIIRFEGPITNPSVECADWALSLSMTLADGEYVEVDTRPWVQTALLNGDISVAGALGTRQWLSRMKLTPSQHDFTYRGSAGGAGATCTVRWRSAWNSI